MPTIGLLVASVASVAVVCGGCRQGSPPPRSPLFDGFEGTSVAGFWRPGSYRSGRYVPGAVAISRAYARTGASSVRITVKEGDIEQVNADGTRLERAELDSGHYAFRHRDVWVGFSFLLPPDFPVVDNRLVISQWKQDGVDAGPLLAQRFRAGEHYLTIRETGAAGGAAEHFPLPAITLGRWNDMIFHVRFSAATDGCVEVWMNGTKVASHTGPNSVGDAENSFYHKIGLYRDRWKEPMAIYFDNYMLGYGFGEVDPARFDPDRRAVEQVTCASGAGAG